MADQQPRKADALLKDIDDALKVSAAGDAKAQTDLRKQKNLDIQGDVVKALVDCMPLRLTSP